MVVLLWVFCFTISAFAGAVAGKSGPYGFLAIWDMLLLIALSVGGTLILRKVRLAEARPYLVLARSQLIDCAPMLSCCHVYHAMRPSHARVYAPLTHMTNSPS